MAKDTFESWAIIELFGRQRIAGKVTEAVLGGCSFLRCDVPEQGEEKAYTKFYGNGAIYSMTPVSEETARAFLVHNRPEPVNTWDLRQLPPGRTGPDDFHGDDLDDYEGDEDPDDYERERGE